MRFRIGAALGVTMLALACASPGAWAGKAGPPFKVNTTTVNDQRGTTVAGLKNGFVVTWHSEDQDGSGFGVYGQRYNNRGARVGGEFRVNKRKANDQLNRSVTGLKDGGFVVAWESFKQDRSGYGIYGRRYNAAGTPVGNEFKVNTRTGGNQQDPSVAGLTDGGFVFTWNSPGDHSRVGIFGQRYNSAGARVGGQFRVNTTTAGKQDRPSVAALNNGRFVVTWTSAAQDGSGLGVYGQRYTAAGARAGGEFPVNTTTADNQLEAAVTLYGNDRFVVVWNAEGDQDGSQHGVFGQLFNAAAQRRGAEFRVNTRTTDNQEFPSVATLDDDGFVVIWHSFNQDGSGNGVYGQRYNKSGARVGGEFQVNTFTGNDQEFSAVAGLSNGGFVAVWRSLDQDGSGYGIYGQRFTR